MEKMENLPEGIIPNRDRDNIVYYDTEKEQFYIIRWIEGGKKDVPVRFYIPKSK